MQTYLDNDDFEYCHACPLFTFRFIKKIQRQVYELRLQECSISPIHFHGPGFPHHGGVVKSTSETPSYPVQWLGFISRDPGIPAYFSTFFLGAGSWQIPGNPGIDFFTFLKQIMGKYMKILYINYPIAKKKAFKGKIIGCFYVGYRLQQ